MALAGLGALLLLQVSNHARRGLQFSWVCPRGCLVLWEALLCSLDQQHAVLRNNTLMNGWER